MYKHLGTGITALLCITTSVAAVAALYGWWRADHWNGLPVPEIALTLATVLLAWLASRWTDCLATGLNEGHRVWQRRLRRWLNVEDSERFREADLLAALLHLAIWLAVPLLLLRIWGLSRTSFDMLRHLAWTGFNLGQVQIVPAQLIMGALLLVLLATIIRWLTGRMENQWLARTPMETHTREAVATITGYVLFVIATLVVLSYVGLDLTKLAFIAGALSVGIGFGLQTIVNNFVSGLILLFEQPVRRGNYITVGETEGFVRRIRIRATEIETLQRTTVVVPNSELLTLHLKNWNLRDRYGRIGCPVGVAYGSDVRLVEKLLLQVASDNTDVISDGRVGVPKPVALFRGFGDSTLDFELRCFIRDVTRRFFVVSDLNFAIDEAFRDHDVTIAFPQLDVWHRSVPPPSHPRTPDDDDNPNSRRND
ncbi:Putative alpha helix protein [Salinisphaera shabanensis E1L3A]|uniref:Alpha helix protein n=1 Tax=Salinisphaera shabanensis E1L3A TaxID=1033802 RepID=U2FV13_9GAMM|nr:mechanosensitive ion channel domain-containing protein [Salinisphaera shabanensis]ERJ18163.1 Putative alpha helix protein [Salinisphaera shabanensis E1L3A]